MPASKQLQNLLQAFLMVSLFELVNVAIISGVASFVGLLLSYAPHKNNQEFAIWGVRQLDVKSNVVAEIF